MEDLRIYTIGHSTRSDEEFYALLKHYCIATLVDVRTIPHSRHNPQFNKESLAAFLTSRRISYIHMKELGGLRRAKKDSANKGLRNTSFRGYGDYMETEEFHHAITELSARAHEAMVCVMCAETLPWKCHRWLLSDALTVQGFKVIHIVSLEKTETHAITPFARVQGKRITYPKQEGDDRGQLSFEF
jgi:uncharacterized protein (DUF488 family)